MPAARLEASTEPAPFQGCSKAGQSRAGQGRAARPGQGRAGQGCPRQARPGRQGRAGQFRAGPWNLPTWGPRPPPGQTRVISVPVYREAFLPHRFDRTLGRGPRSEPRAPMQMVSGALGSLGRNDQSFLIALRTAPCTR